MGGRFVGTPPVIVGLDVDGLLDGVGVEGTLLGTAEGPGDVSILGTTDGTSDTDGAAVGRRNTLVVTLRSTGARSCSRSAIALSVSSSEIPQRAETLSFKAALKLLLLRLPTSCEHASTRKYEKRTAATLILLGVLQFVNDHS